jgi:hypothetical protein
MKASCSLYARVGGRNVAKLNIGFILARRFTLCALANFVDVLRLAADEGDLPHLIRAFRAAEGVTPEAFRKSRA